jgi:hypothetical protein
MVRIKIAISMHLRLLNDEKIHALVFPFKNIFAIINGTPRNPAEITGGFSRTAFAQFQ